MLGGKLGTCQKDELQGYFFTLFASRLMRRALVLIIFILKVSRPLLSNHAIILDDLRWKNLIIMAQQQWL